jgi:Zn-finger nucleic acid-binding protein
MKCPVCKEPDLVMAERQGVEIDYCPTCRGVWLDRGELDKIIEKSVAAEAGRAAPAEASRPGPSDAYYREDRHHDDHGQYEQGKYDSHGRRKRSWLGDLFD